jgi:hypothetical protein
VPLAASALLDQRSPTWDAFLQRLGELLALKRVLALADWAVVLGGARSEGGPPVAGRADAMAEISLQVSVCLPVCLPACLPVWLLACLPVCLLA